MKRPLLLLFGLFLPSCMLFQQRIARPTHAPPEEEAKVQRPFGVPREGEVHLQGNMVAAIQLAMDHFLPSGIQPSPKELESKEPCEFQRGSYDVTAVPVPDGVMLVRFAVNPEVCPLTKVSVNLATGQPAVDMTTYAVDVRTGRILSIESEPLRRPRPESQKKEGPPAADHPDAGADGP